MKLHPRHKVRRNAERQFLDFYIQWIDENDLTVDEFIGILLDRAVSLNRSALAKNQTEHTPGEGSEQ